MEVRFLGVGTPSVFDVVHLERGAAYLAVGRHTDSIFFCTTRRSDHFEYVLHM